MDKSLYLQDDDLSFLLKEFPTMFLEQINYYYRKNDGNLEDTIEELTEKFLPPKIELKDNDEIYYVYRMDESGYLCAFPRLHIG